jgi:phospholipid N-methyltransferase
MPPLSAERPAGRQSAWGFLREFLGSARRIGAVAPTSRGVARRMARLAGVGASEAVLEFGSGTGPITRELLRELPADGRLWGFEIHPPFIEALQTSIADSRFLLRQQSAAEAAAVREQERPQGFDAIICSLPFSLFPTSLTNDIIVAAGRALRPGGSFVALQYLPFYLPPFLDAHFRSVRREFYPWNIPPVFLYTCRDPREE